ncbi:MAG: N-acetylmuramoyl-L-alanine amidase [Cytophagales bacterium]|nr:N-acetylmuramoyl-L-alanine amidase [Cytophagales bacterium]
MKGFIAITLFVLLSSYHFVDDADNSTVSSTIFRVAIDHGLGGQDEGMSFNGAMEKAITDAIAKQIPQFDLGVSSVHLLGTNDSYETYKERIKDSRHLDLYISIHTNYNKALRSGPSVFYSGKNDHSESSQAYGKFFASHLSDQSGISQKAESELYVLDRLQCPAIHIDAGNLGTIDDFYHLTSEDGQKEIAQKIAKAIHALADLKQDNVRIMKAKTLKPKIDALFIKDTNQGKQ